MRMWSLGFVVLALMATGCASSGKPPKYVTNWDQIKPGMSKSQVSKLLGLPHLVSTQPDARVHVSVPDPNDAWSGFRQDVDAVFSDGELWQYGKYRLSDYEEPPELLSGSPRSFQVFFDSHGKVTHYRRPVDGPYASTTRPVYTGPGSQSPESLWQGDMFGRDKDTAGPSTKANP